MIGGVDNVVAISSPLDATWRRKTFMMIFALWPDAVVEALDEDGAVPILDAIELVQAEFFVYENRASHEAWTEHGATPAYEGSMIQFIIGDRQVTWVVGERHGEVVGMISDTVRLGLLENGVAP